MKKKFKKTIREIETKFNRLWVSPAHVLKKISGPLPEKGIYLLSEGQRVLYVGRSNNLKSRLRNHHAGISHFQATFAFLMAREATMRFKATYRKEGSRAELLKDKKFKRCFDLARIRIGRMKVRVIEETDPTKQALLEIYAAFVTKAKHNNFENH